MGGEFDDDDKTFNDTNSVDEGKEEAPELKEEGGGDESVPAENGAQSAGLTSQSPLLRQETELEMASGVHDELETNIMGILESHKLGLFGRGKDSTQMDTLKTNLTDLLSIFYKKIPENKKEFEAGVSEVQNRFRKAIQSADEYVEYITSNKKGRSIFGKKRLNLTRKIQKQMVNERRFFAASAKALRENRNADESFYWRDVIREVRARKIDLKGENVTIVGSGASRIYRVDNGDGSLSYIKPEERMANSAEDYQSIVAMFRNTSPGAATLLNLMEETFLKYAPKGVDVKSVGEKGEKEFVCTFAKSLEDVGSFTVSDKDPKTGRKKSDEEIASEKRALKISRIVELVQKTNLGIKLLNEIGDNEDYLVLLADFGDFVNKKSNEAFNGNRLARIRAGSTISDRNASSYRLAESLGQGNLIAKSETIVMQDEFGRSIRANSMEGVGGMTFAEAYQYAKDNNLTLSMTPESLSQFFNMRILDLMSGQIDRHMDNFKVGTHIEGSILYVDSVKGIDNDLAFGLLSAKDMLGTIGSNMDAIMASNTEGFVHESVQTVKYITEDFYNRILDYDDQMVEYDQMDIRTKEEIKALQDRIKGVRQTLKILVAAGKLRIVKTAEEMREAYEESREYYRRIASKAPSSWKNPLASGDVLGAIR